VTDVFAFFLASDSDVFSSDSDVFSSVTEYPFQTFFFLTRFKFQNFSFGCVRCFSSIPGWISSISRMKNIYIKSWFSSFSALKICTILQGKTNLYFTRPLQIWIQTVSGSANLVLMACAARHESMMASWMPSCLPSLLG
jgi:hypothetical protein